MSLAGKRDDFTLTDLMDAGTAALLKPRQTKAILAEVHAAVLRWPEFAAAAKVRPDITASIQSGLRTGLFS
jgi:serine/threonine-protein kinase HipA